MPPADRVDRHQVTSFCSFNCCAEAATWESDEGKQLGEENRECKYVIPFNSDKNCSVFGPWGNSERSVEVVEPGGANFACNNNSDMASPTNLYNVHLDAYELGDDGGLLHGNVSLHLRECAALLSGIDADRTFFVPGAYSH